MWQSLVLQQQRAVALMAWQQRQVLFLQCRLLGV
jgi:hypothetical protein